MKEAYILPNGNVQISFSGGRTSAYMLRMIADANGGLPDRVRVIFANTGREMPETLDFVEECASRWQLPVTWLEDAERGGGVLFRIVDHSSASRNGEPFERLIQRKRKCPDVMMRFCTDQLKVTPARRYLKALGWGKWTNTLGIRADETRRAKPSTDARVMRWFPLVDAGVRKRDVLEWWAKQPFDLQTREGLGNCDGCFLKSEATLAALARDYPNRHAWWERAETIATEASGRPNARFNKAYTREELRAFIESQGDWLFETEGALCQANGGECT